MSKINKPFWENSYDRHSNHDKFPNPEKMETWKNFNTIDAWRHNRMYENIQPLIKNFPFSSWLTIGDGRYGTDANYLLRNNIVNVLATNISDLSLNQAKKDGFIQDYKIENAESLSFLDNSFEFVFCKEAYHHFPRPIIALYEMLRVASKAIIIIEPNDTNVKSIDGPTEVIEHTNKWQIIKNFIKDILNIDRYVYTSYHDPIYEVVGNYVYTTSKREFEKVALGINLPLVAFKGMNDYYEEGVEFEIANESSSLFKKIKTGIEKADKNCKNSFSNYGLLVSIIFKETPNIKTLEDLKNIGFEIKELPRNPYM